MLENEPDNAGSGDGTGGAADHGAVSTGPSRGGVSSRPAGPPDPAPPAPAVPVVAFKPPQVLFQAPQAQAPAVAERPAAAPAAETSGGDEDNGPRPARRRSRAKADTGPADKADKPDRAEQTAKADKKPDPSESTAPESAQAAPDTASSDQASSDRASSDRASSDRAGLDRATSDRAGADDTSGPDDESDEDGGQSGRRRRRRGGRSRSRSRGGNGAGDGDDDAESDDSGDADTEASESAEGGASDHGSGDDEDSDENGEGNGTGRRRRRKRRRGSASDSDKPGSEDDPPDTVVHVREARPAAASKPDDVRAIKGSTRLEAKRQRRREGRESGRRRPPVITESEFLARREAVDRTMVVRRRGDRTQIAVLEDDVLVEHYVNRASHQSYVGNVYLGKVQNVLPSMEAAFVDIGKGRNAVLYAGEVNFDASGLEGQSKRIESALKSGQSILVQVTKDPVGHKGARLTSQVSLPGRYLVYVPGASMTGISRKLPDTERTRLKKILKKVMPEDAGVIVRTAAEGATEEELERDVARLAAQWEAIERKTKAASAPDLLYGEPDLTIRVIRDVFNEDFSQLIVSGDDGWAEVDEYVSYVAPHLADRLSYWDNPDGQDVFAEYRIDEQLTKAMERKVWLPSGGSLVIDRTEAMTVIDVNTGKFTGQGGNLEETVTRNNLEAAEEIVRQLRLRDVGGIIVIDFIDMVLESNRDLVLRRLLECLARDRTKHQVAEVTSLGLVQMTRKRVGVGLLEAFSETCECCNGRGVHVSLDLGELGTSGSGTANGNGNGHGRGRHERRNEQADQSNGHGNSSGANGNSNAANSSSSNAANGNSNAANSSSNGGNGNGGNGNGESKPGEGRRSRNRRRGNRQDQTPSPEVLAAEESAAQEAVAILTDPRADQAEAPVTVEPAELTELTVPAETTPVTDAPVPSGALDATTAPASAPAPAASAPETTPITHAPLAPEAPTAPVTDATSAPEAPATSEVSEAAPAAELGPDLEATEAPAAAADPTEPPTEGPNGEY
jgi:ribonuclease E